MQTKTAGEQEGEMTGAIEAQTSKVPSGAYLGAAVGAMAASAILKLNGKDEWASFVGHWAPTLLILGVYNKMVKQHGTDAESNGHSNGRRSNSRRTPVAEAAD
jgi:outer membrane lipoprotein SlyB